MSQKTRNNAIRAENRKALPKFFAVILTAAVIGFFGGFLIAYFGDTSADFFLAMLNEFWRRGLLYFPVLVMVLFGIPSTVLLITARKKAKNLAEDDEAGAEKVDGLLNAAMIVNTFHQLADFFVLAIILSTITKEETWRTFLALGLFLLSTIWQVVVQQKTVDAAKLLYPEKRGSVYSSKFNKEWLQSCDERERAEIYHCGYTGYKFGIYACLILFVVTAIGAVPFGYGPVPSGVVLLIWLCMTLGYLKEAVRSGKKKK